MPKRTFTFPSPLPPCPPHPGCPRPLDGTLSPAAPAHWPYIWWTQTIGGETIPDCWHANTSSTQVSTKSLRGQWLLIGGHLKPFLALYAQLRGFYFVFSLDVARQLQRFLRLQQEMLRKKVIATQFRHHRGRWFCTAQVRNCRWYTLSTKNYHLPAPQWLIVARGAGGQSTVWQWAF